MRDTKPIRSFNPRSPRGERRVSAQLARQPPDGFNPRSPRGERRAHRPRYLLECLFQSTLPAWGATRQSTSSKMGGRVSIHAPRVGSDGRARTFRAGVRVSIHAPRVGSDRSASFEQDRVSVVSIHAPRVGSDAVYSQQRRDHQVSIHAPRVGSDTGRENPHRLPRSFNPRSPRGERRFRGYSVTAANGFNPRSPRGERRRGLGRALRGFRVSIHAPRVGSDVQRNIVAAVWWTVSIHAPRVGSDCG